MEKKARIINRMMYNDLMPNYYGRGTNQKTGKKVQFRIPYNYSERASASFVKNVMIDKITVPQPALPTRRIRELFKFLRTGRMQYCPRCGTPISIHQKPTAAKSLEYAIFKANERSAQKRDETAVQCPNPKCKQAVYFSTKIFEPLLDFDVLTNKLSNEQVFSRMCAGTQMFRDGDRDFRLEITSIEQGESNTRLKGRLISTIDVMPEVGIVCVKKFFTSSQISVLQIEMDSTASK